MDARYKPLLFYIYEVDIDADYHCFDVDDKFLVGYGLDYDGYYRNIPYIGYVEGV